MIQSQDRQAVPHGFQNLRAERIAQARKKEGVRTLIQTRHVVPRYFAKKGHFGFDAQTSRAILPRLAHLAVASNQRRTFTSPHFGQRFQGQR